jgi:hypothetical protein
MNLWIEGLIHGLHFYWRLWIILHYNKRVTVWNLMQAMRNMEMQITLSMSSLKLYFKLLEECGLIHLKLEIVEEPLYCLKFIENTYEKLHSDRVCKKKNTYLMLHSDRLSNLGQHNETFIRLGVAILSIRSWSIGLAHFQTFYTIWFCSF